MEQATRGIYGHVIGQLDKVKNKFLRDTLKKSFTRQKKELERIEDSFHMLLKGKDSTENLKYFFRSWSNTNHSCMRVSAISNRLSMKKYSGENVIDQNMLFQSIANLNRIADEDLGVGGGELHHDMFYRMATGICGDDEWLLKKYCLEDAQSFKIWADRNALREEDMLIPLLMTAIHEIYTHGEVEFIQPLYKEWLIKQKGYTEKKSASTIYWITAHCYPTEVNHFLHGLQAIEYYLKAFDINIEDYDVKGIFDEYLLLKGNVMEGLTNVYNN